MSVALAPTGFADTDSTDSARPTKCLFYGGQLDGGVHAIGKKPARCKIAMAFIDGLFDPSDLTKNYRTILP